VKRIVSASAYLLFYRRRSEGLLGGPRFLEILTQNEKAETSEDDEVDSGEGQGLDAESSLRGSSSALTGVGAALHQISGSGTEMGQKTTVNPRDLDALPAYQAHETEEDSAPLLLSDAQENEGLGLQQSVEEDEGIDMGTGYNTMNLSSPGDDDFNSDSINPNPILGLGQESWTFDGLTSLNLDNRQYSNKISGNCSEIDCDDNSGFEDRSDIVQHDSSPSESSRRGRLEEFDNAIATNEDGDVWEDPSPVPDVEDENQLDTLTLHRELLQTHRGPPEFQVHAPAEDEEVDQPATEIHIEPSEELKID
jgi:ubiquitin carboxyl-terminal hydrolase 4/11/15